MTALLVVLTFVALAVAGVLLFYVLRLSHEDRERHEARSAALAEMIGEGPVTRDVVHDVQADALVEAPVLFGEVQADRRSGSPLLLAAGVVIVLIAVAGIYLVNRAGGAAAASQATAPLELTSLAHERTGESLKISGLVHNPRAGRAYSDVAAVVFTFDRQGNYLSSGRAGLDFRQLPPGEESPFAITLPSAAGVVRYRVSFRTEAAMIPHIDRRNPPPARERGEP
jgi:flagellar basal body-associated protein FliL